MPGAFMAEQGGGAGDESEHEALAEQSSPPEPLKLGRRGEVQAGGEAAGGYHDLGEDAEAWTAVPGVPTTEGENQTVTATISETTLFRLEIATP